MFAALLVFLGLAHASAADLDRAADSDGSDVSAVAGQLSSPGSNGFGGRETLDALAADLGRSDCPGPE